MVFIIQIVAVFLPIVLSFLSNCSETDITCVSCDFSDCKGPLGEPMPVRYYQLPITCDAMLKIQKCFKTYSEITEKSLTLLECYPILIQTVHTFFFFF